MGQARGTVTIPNSTLESYGGASISLMNNTNGIQSGGSAGGTKTVYYEFHWDDSGLIGLGWGMTGNYEERLSSYTDERLEEYLNDTHRAEAVVTAIREWEFDNSELPSTCFVYREIE